MKKSRKEIKYKVSNSVCDKIKKELHKILKFDENVSKNNYYNILSIYFDNLDFKFFLDKVEGQENRVKPRLRYYFDDNLYPTKCFLELKKKYNAIGDKNKIQLPIKDALNFVNGKYKEIYKNYKNNRAFNEFLKLDKKFFLKPKVRIFYQREAFYSDIFTGFRITFDRNIQASISKSTNLKTFNRSNTVLNQNFQIIELKSNYEIPNSVINFFKKFELNQIAYSKYVESVSSCYKFHKLIKNRYLI